MFSKLVGEDTDHGGRHAPEWKEIRECVNSFYFLKYSPPPDSIISITKPNERRFSYNMIFRNKTPVAAVKRIMAIISHHPIIIHFESVWSANWPAQDMRDPEQTS